MHLRSGWHLGDSEIAQHVGRLAGLREQHAGGPFRKATASLNSEDSAGVRNRPSRPSYTGQCGDDCTFLLPKKTTLDFSPQALELRRFVPRAVDKQLHNQRYGRPLGSLTEGVHPICTSASTYMSSRLCGLHTKSFL